MTTDLLRLNIRERCGYRACNCRHCRHHRVERRIQIRAARRRLRIAVKAEDRG